jgi:NADP-reducing hydrogenase subunit HndD
MKIDPSKIFLATIMPCTAKKHEILKHKTNGIQDCDATITVRELGKLLKRQGINFSKLQPSKADDVFGAFSGAGLIFGATGGVMEAAIRTAVDTLTGESVETIDYKKVRGIKGIKEATVKVGDLKINVCAVSGLANARKVLESVQSGEKKYHFIEVMACPGGCVNGGGMPLHDPNVVPFEERAQLRGRALYLQDAKLPIRKSHENPSIIKIYKEFFKHPGSHKAHEVLHTHYEKRNFI